jgi:hypothetical protein
VGGSFTFSSSVKYRWAFNITAAALTTQFPEFGDIDPENYLQAFVTDNKYKL